MERAYRYPSEGPDMRAPCSATRTSTLAQAGSRFQRGFFQTSATPTPGSRLDAAGVCLADIGVLITVPPCSWPCERARTVVLHIKCAMHNGVNRRRAVRSSAARCHRCCVPAGPFGPSSRRGRPPSPEAPCRERAHPGRHHRRPAPPGPLFLLSHLLDIAAASATSIVLRGHWEPNDVEGDRPRRVLEQCTPSTCWRPPDSATLLREGSGVTRHQAALRPETDRIVSTR